MKAVGIIRKGAYFDSVTLMQVARKLTALDGVTDAAVVMGTRANQGILQSSNLLLAEFKKAGDSDLLIAIKARDAKAADAARKAADELLKEKKAADGGSTAEARPRSLDAALQMRAEANLALISVAGRYAGDVAMDCLERDLHVMLFSDNVPVEQEIRLKHYARRKGLLVMGPDCGTAIINGAPLGFANAVRRGGIGVVAAAGTGMQEITSLISNAGGGISQAIGTGGRDLSKAVGGITFIQGIEMLAKDPATRVIVLASKPPDKSVLTAVERALRRVKKPVVTFFIGAQLKPGDPETLEEAALMAVERERGESIEDARLEIRERDQAARVQADALRRQLQASQRYVRGLFSGGTFCAEAQILLQDRLGVLYANTPTGRTRKLKNAQKSVGHTFIDFGDDEFTQGRPHPMVDFTLRNKRIRAEALDPETAVILLDVVLGYGAHPDPLSELAPVVREAERHVPVVCSVTGTDDDPQIRGVVIDGLREAGALVLPSNAAACRMAGWLARPTSPKGGAR